MSARDSLRQRLIASVPSVDGRVFEISTAQPTTQFPFLVLKSGPEDTGQIWSDVGQPFEIWPYAAPVTSRFDSTPYAMLDIVCAEIQQAFNGRNGFWFIDAGIPRVAIWLGGAGDDFEDPGWQGAVTRAQRVEVSSLAWLLADNIVLRALRTWTLLTFPEFVVDPSSVALSDDHPWIFWRMNSLPVAGEALNLDLDWFDASVALHVVAPTPAMRMTVVSEIVYALQTGGFWPPSIPMEDGSNMQIKSARTAPDADPRTQGQAVIDVQFIGQDISDLYGPGPKIRQAIIYGPPSHTSTAPDDVSPSASSAEVGRAVVGSAIVGTS
jgi:hypothetical protein